MKFSSTLLTIVALPFALAAPADVSGIMIKSIHVTSGRIGALGSAFDNRVNLEACFFGKYSIDASPINDGHHFVTLAEQSSGFTAHIKEFKEVLVNTPNRGCFRLLFDVTSLPVDKRMDVHIGRTSSFAGAHFYPISTQREDGSVYPGSVIVVPGSRQASRRGSFSHYAPALALGAGTGAGAIAGAALAERIANHVEEEEEVVTGAVTGGGGGGGFGGLQGHGISPYHPFPDVGPLFASTGPSAPADAAGTFSAPAEMLNPVPADTTGAFTAAPFEMTAMPADAGVGGGIGGGGADVSGGDCCGDCGGCDCDCGGCGGCDCGGCSIM